MKLGSSNESLRKLGKKIFEKTKYKILPARTIFPEQYSHPPESVGRFVTDISFECFWFILYFCHWYCCRLSVVTANQSNLKHLY
jgi:hypothetical protein